MLEAQILCLTYYPVTYFEMLGRPWRDRAQADVPGVAQAARRAGRPRLRHRRSSGSTSARWSATRSGSTRTAAVDHRAGQLHADDRRLAAATTASTRSSTWPRPSASPTRRSATARTSPAIGPLPARGTFVRNPRDGFCSPAGPTGCDRRDLRRTPEPAPRLGEHTDALPRRRAPSSRPDPRCGAERVAVRGLAGARHDRVLGRSVAARTCWRCSAPRSSTSSRPAAPTAPGWSPACRSPRTSGGSSRRSSPA